MSQGILAITEQVDGKFKNISFEAISTGKKIADATDGPLSAAVMGAGGEALRAVEREAFRLAAATAEFASLESAHRDVQQSGGGHDAGLVAGHRVAEALALLQLDDVEIDQRHVGVVDVDDGSIGVVKGGNMHGASFQAALGPA